MSSNVSVHLRVTDLNDNTPNCSTVRPIFITKNHNLRDTIGWVSAHDNDEGINGNLSYRLQQFDELFNVKLKGMFYIAMLTI